MNPDSEEVGRAILRAVEDQLDAEIEKLDSLQVSDLDNIRRRRLAEMAEEKRNEESWRLNGHGEYNEIAEADFFVTLKKSNSVIMHFFLDDKRRCTIVDHHLKLLAASHLEARIVKINAMNAPFLCGRLNVRIIPSILIFIGNKAVDRISGFTDLGGVDDFPTEMLEWRLGESKVIKFEGERPSLERKSSKLVKLYPSQSSIRQGGISDVDSDDEYIELTSESCSIESCHTVSASVSAELGDMDLLKGVHSD